MTNRSPAPPRSQAGFTLIEPAGAGGVPGRRMTRRRAVLAGLAMSATALCSAARAGPMPIEMIKVQPIVVCDAVGTNCASLNLDEAAVQKIYNQAGIAVAFAPTVKYDAPQYLTTQVFVGPSGANDPTDQAHELLRGYQQANPAADPQMLNMFFVDQLTRSDGGPINGYGLTGSNGSIIGSSAPIDTAAHELGHNLGLAHSDGNGSQDIYNLGPALALNLMNSASRTVATSLGSITPDGIATDQLIPAQIATARQPLFTVQGAGATAQAFAGGAPVACMPGNAECEFDVQIQAAPAQFADSLNRLKIRFSGNDPVQIDPTLTPFVTGFGSATCSYGGTKTTTAGGFGTELDFTIPTGCFNEYSFSLLSLIWPAGSTYAAPLSFEFDFADGTTSTALFDQSTGIANTANPSTVYGIDGPTQPSAGFVAPPLGAADIDYNLDPRQQATAVPEPASSALLLSGAGLLVMLRRSTRRHSV